MNNQGIVVPWDAIEHFMKDVTTPEEFQEALAKIREHRIHPAPSEASLRTFQEDLARTLGAAD